MTNADGYEHDEDCPEGYHVPNYRFEILGVLGIAVTWLGNVLGTTGMALHAVAGEINAASNHRRANLGQTSSDADLLAYLESKDD